MFASAPLQKPLPFRGHRLGIVICEDMWLPDVAEALAKDGAQILIVPNGSPYEKGKTDRRARQALARAQETGLPVLYVNQIGGQDELVFDGASFIVAGGKVTIIAPAFESAVVETKWGFEFPSPARLRLAPSPAGRGDSIESEIYAALVLGLRDYVGKK